MTIARMGGSVVPGGRSVNHRQDAARLASASQRSVREIDMVHDDVHENFDPQP